MQNIQKEEMACHKVFQCCLTNVILFTTLFRKDLILMIGIKSFCFIVGEINSYLSQL